jgi:ribosomal-protein-alanine N-acetyltransferase
MRHDDIDRVLALDREAFPTEWPPPNFKRELENRIAYYVVACSADELAEAVSPEAPAASGETAGFFSRLRARLGRGARPHPERSARGDERVTGFAGFWVMADEAHIITIASGDQRRGTGVGELLLQSLIGMAIRRKARIVTLEVRVSNTGAQALYTKYGFRNVGFRRAYYSDNKEDAIIMSTDHLTSAPYQELLRTLRARYDEKWGEERYRLEE